MDRKIFYVIAFCMMILWLGIMGLFYLKADEVTKDPCSICAKRMGEEIICTTGGYQPITKTFYPNFTIKIQTP